jgi:hypothetical protein
LWACFVAWWWLPVKWVALFPFTFQATVSRFEGMNEQLDRIEEAVLRLGDVIEDQAALADVRKERARRSA